MSKFE